MNKDNWVGLLGHGSALLTKLRGEQMQSHVLSTGGTFKRHLRPLLMGFKIIRGYLLSLSSLHGINIKKSENESKNVLKESYAAPSVGSLQVCTTLNGHSSFLGQISARDAALLPCSHKFTT